MTNQDFEEKPQKEPEHQGSAWSHPYLIYVALTVALFGFLIFMGYLAKVNHWIPNRGIQQNSAED